jgi:STE24 endopeptidase
MDESRRTSHGNAYLSGFGRNKRIVLYDTLLAKHPADEIEAVLAHELGHFRLRHVHYGLALTLVMSFAGFFVVGEIARQAWFLEGFGYPGADDALSLILCMISFSVISPVSQMIGNAVSRHHELQADRFARDMTGAAPMISALLTLARENAQPIASDPLYALYNYSHPSMAERVAHLRAGA